MRNELNPAPADLLREVLENLDAPENLEDHPWAYSRLVQEECARQPSLNERPAGQRLAFAVVHAFREMIPPAPPRQGKRLDTRWGEFGLLAARYFAPFLNGQHYPASLREAWHGMDAAILSFVFDGRTDAGEDEKQRYRFAANEPEAAPDSTLSDWHRKGIQRLAEGIDRREKYLQNLPSAKAAAKRKRSSRRVWIYSILGLLLLLAAGLGLGAVKARKAYDLALVVRKDAAALKGLASSGADLAALKQAGPALDVLRGDFGRLREEVQPLLPFTPFLEWIPVYGGDLASSGKLLGMADLLLQGAGQAESALDPLISAMEEGGSITPPRAIEMLDQAAPGLTEARASLSQAAALRSEVDTASLSPRARGLLEQYIDPILPKLRDGLDAALALPGFMGATSAGPKTYLLLAENEDELRATGGFITAAGNLVVRDGQILSLTFQDTGLLDDWAMPYPPSPWQLEDYMNSTVLVLRDSNWYTDFPVTAETAEYLYSYVSRHSVDGVIAFDQHSLVMLLGVLGPVQVPGHEGLVDASNVLEFMRQSKTISNEEWTREWSYKRFIGDLATAVFHKLYATDTGDWESLFKYLVTVLDEKHMLIQLDEPALAGVLSRNGWDGSVAAPAGDFLMVVDSNVGFNKTNAVVKTSLIYDVDLTDPDAPTGSLTVVHENQSPFMHECKHWDKTHAPGQEKYPIYDCYWDYMRVYMTSGAALLNSEAQDIPAGWMIQETRVPPRMDVLDEDEIDGLQAFGTMLVAPGGQTIETGLTVSLPPSILEHDAVTGVLHYHLTVKKQPGTIATPITIRLHLPAGAQLDSVPPGAVITGKDVLLSTDLQRDLSVELVFFP